MLRRFSSAASRFHLKCGSCVIPLQGKPGDGDGEDAHFYGPHGVGVFDGVGGWARYGIDPRAYSQKLMESTRRAHLLQHQYAIQCNDVDNLKESVHLHPRHALHAGWIESASTKGACTAIVGTLDGDILRLLAIGDCQAMVIRDMSDIVLRTESQQHSFNRPFQLGPASGDRPEDGLQFDLQVKAGDVVVFGSDGLFDNLEDEAIVKHIQNTYNASKEKTSFFALDAAVTVCEETERISQDKNVETPFSRGAREAFGNFAEPFDKGGKPDDITCVIAQVLHGDPVFSSTEATSETVGIQGGGGKYFVTKRTETEEGDGLSYGNTNPEDLF
eukprot:g4542.t1